MKDINIPETSSTPKINFNFTEGNLEITGRSLPENVLEFYTPLMKQLEDYLTFTKGPVNLIFRLDYFNTASAKVIVDILFMLKKTKDRGVAINAEWLYEEYDDDMKDVGIRFAEITGVDLKIAIFEKDDL